MVLAMKLAALLILTTACVAHTQEWDPVEAQVRDTIAQSKGWLEASLAGGEDDNPPELVKELLMYGRIKHTVGAVVCLALMLLCVLWIWKDGPELGEAVLLPALLALGALAATVTFSYWALVAWSAPRLYLLNLLEEYSR